MTLSAHASVRGPPTAPLGPPCTRVSLVVSAEDEVEGRVTSFVSRELRSLGDVVVTDTGADFVVAIVALTLTSVGSQRVDGLRYRRS